jgi:hypothetical protein
LPSSLREMLFSQKFQARTISHLLKTLSSKTSRPASKVDIWANPIMRIVSQKSDHLRLPIEQTPPHSRC